MAASFKIRKIRDFLENQFRSDYCSSL